MTAADMTAADTRVAYLRRLGLDPEPPSADALVRLHRAHVERIPWETLWIHLGDHWSTDASESMHRVATQGRGGYCFHLNGAFSELLGALGYDVTRHVGGVHGPDGPSDDAMANHLVLTVAGLPSAENPDGAWYVDVGLGDALHDPVPLVAGEYRQGPFRLVLDEAPELGGWHLTHDPRGSFPGMAWRTEATEMAAFADKHEFLSTSPDSGFVQVATVQTRDATGADVLRGLTLRRIGEGVAVSTLQTQAELQDALADVFGLDLAAIGLGELDAFWPKVSAAHEAWVAAGRP